MSEGVQSGIEGGLFQYARAYVWNDKLREARLRQIWWKQIKQRKKKPARMNRL